jgi:alpha-glucosidase
VSSATTHPVPGPDAEAVAWWHEAVVYHVYLPSFRDADGDGYGDLAGLIHALPYLDETLGVDALWVSPFFVSPWRDGGYDIADHTAIDPRYGDLETFDRLVAALHDRGMRLIVDYVPNHTSDQHRWFAASRSSRDDPKRDWYVWATARPGERYPNNWVSEAGGSVWEWDDGTEQFYLHSHLREQPDLNWRNPDVRAAMLDVLRFWLDRGVDGFRIDVAHMLMKDPELRDNPPAPDVTPNPYDRQHPDFTTQLHVHDRRHPDLHGVLREIRALLDGYGDRVAIGELDVMPWSEWAAYYGADLDELHLPMNFSLIETPWKDGAVRSAIAELEGALPAGAWPAHNLGNHDRSRIATRYGPGQARNAALLLLALRGTPILYYGDELGMTDVDVPPERRRDGFAEAEDGPCRDVNRTPMPWSADRHAGFAPPEADEPWLPLGPDYRTANVRHLLGDPRSILALYRRLLALRREHPALRTGSLRVLEAVVPDVLVLERRAGAERLLVALNLAGTHRVLRVARGAAVLASTHLDRQGPLVTTELFLRGGEGVVIELAG